MDPSNFLGHVMLFGRGASKITPRPVLTANALFFFSPKLSYVPFVLAWDPLGQLGLKNKFRNNMLDPILNLFFFEIICVQHISLTYFVFCCCVLNSATYGPD